MIINQGFGKENLKEVLTEQDALLAELSQALEGKSIPPDELAVHGQLIESQDGLISQIMTALEGKSAGGANIETCKLTFMRSSGLGSIYNGFWVNYLGSDLNLYEGGISAEFSRDDVVEYNVAKNTIVTLTIDIPITCFASGADNIRPLPMEAFESSGGSMEFASFQIIGDATIDVQVI